MRPPPLITATLGLALFAAMTPAQERKAPRADSNESLRFDGARVETYKTIGDVKLNIHIFEPAGHRAADKRPAIVFFFGGGWRSGSPRQFEQQCRYLASRGMVAMTADYRVLSRHGTPAIKCVLDGKSAIRWARANAKRLGVNPDRIAAGGGSAGGHVAACTGVITGLDEPGEDTAVSSVPNAMVLFNPALVLAPVEGRAPLGGGNMDGLKERMGIEPQKLSPYHNVRKGAPPALVIHGKADSTVPYWTAEIFAEAMTKAGNRCELAGYEGQQHGFFNFGRGDNKHFIETARAMDQFLVSVKFLQGKPTIDEFAKSLGN
jgi:acetyl esterase/lipase